ncbi:E3 ubiquitin-protein ligase SIAH2 [Orchesella cincta]|uniref:E3 ubiquitin-protein ligase n=1 Tax=Orchesella cincta TaxID=48709 RepID=A0A1D2NB17_ORCCI|nr:E3 ubiquitin-protein ligase SIAH2 [Orchesella cincta]
MLLSEQKTHLVLLFVRLKIFIFCVCRLVFCLTFEIEEVSMSGLEMDGSAVGDRSGIAESEVQIASQLRGPNASRSPRTESVVSITECPVCFDVSLPIYQCINGHIICNSCLQGLTEKNCPSCRVSLAKPTRNLALEKVLKSYKVMLPCKYSSNGCTVKRVCEEKEAHQLICPFKTYACPMSNNNNCRWEGRLDEIVDHLKGRRRPSHFVPLLFGETATFYFPAETDAESQLAIQIQTCFGTYFLIALKITAATDPNAGNEYFALVQVIGHSEVASRYAYRMELERDGRRLSWEAVPLEISDNVKHAMDKGDCLCFSSKTMMLFKNREIDLIPLVVTISEV